MAVALYGALRLSYWNDGRQVEGTINSILYDLFVLVDLRLIHDQIL